jgi:hypothetical protein
MLACDFSLEELRTVVADSLRAWWIGAARPFLSGLLGLGLGLLCLRRALLRRPAAPLARVAPGPVGGQNLSRPHAARKYAWCRPPSTGRTSTVPVGERAAG